MFRVLVVSGETSGDQVVAPYVASLVERGVTCLGIGGDALVSIGLQPLASRDGASVSGTTEAISALWPTFQLFKILAKAMSDVDGLLLVDFPEVNMRLLRRAKQEGKPVVYLAPPQAWAWRPWRAKALQQADFVGCLFKFTADWFCSRGVRAQFIGHPLAYGAKVTGQKFNRIALLPGSREGTIRRALPKFLEVVGKLKEREPSLSVVMAKAPCIERKLVDKLLGPNPWSIEVWDDVEEVLADASVALVHPGTATLHAALRGCFPVTLATPSPLTELMGSFFLNVEHLSLPNLILGERFFPEFIASRANLDDIVTALLGGLKQTLAQQDNFESLRERCEVGSAPERVLRVLDTFFS